MNAISSEEDEEKLGTAHADSNGDIDEFANAQDVPVGWVDGQHEHEEVGVEEESVEGFEEEKGIVCSELKATVAGGRYDFNKKTIRFMGKGQIGPTNQVRLKYFKSRKGFYYFSFKLIRKIFITEQTNFEKVVFEQVKFFFAKEITICSKTED